MCGSTSIAKQRGLSSSNYHEVSEFASHGVLSMHHHPRDHLATSQSMSQLPGVTNRNLPSAGPQPVVQGARSRERVSISNLINAVDQARITAVAQPPLREPARGRRTGRGRAQSAHGSVRTPLGPAELDEIAARRRKIQSEKKRLWRKNLSPDQKAKRQEMDAQRKREQRLNMTPDQRAEARRKDAARKAAKRRLQKEQMRNVEPQSMGSGLRVQGGPTQDDLQGASTRSLPAAAIASAAHKRRSPIEDLLN